MIYPESKLLVADNSGAKRVKCIKVLKSSKRTGGKATNIAVVSIRKVKRSKRLMKGNVCKGVLVRLKKNIQRDTGMSVKFSVNSVILIDAKNVPLGSRVFGPIFKEIRFQNFPKMLSLAKTLL